MTRLDVFVVGVVLAVWVAAMAVFVRRDDTPRHRRPPR